MYLCCCSLLYAGSPLVLDLLQALCPWLHCGDAGLLGSLQPLQLLQQRLGDLKQQVDTAGVAQV
jgi:hypothetical protein